MAIAVTGWDKLDVFIASIIPNKTVEFLGTEIYNSTLIIINYWSFIHFGAGVLFYYLRPKDFKLWIKIIIAFEIIEYFLGIGGNLLFVEATKDIIIDIILTISGFAIAMKLREGKWPKLKW